MVVWFVTDHNTLLSIFDLMSNTIRQYYSNLLGREMCLSVNRIPWKANWVSYDKQFCLILSFNYLLYRRNVNVNDLTALPELLVAKNQNIFEIWPSILRLFGDVLWFRDFLILTQGFCFAGAGVQFRVGVFYASGCTNVPGTICGAEVSLQV